MEKNDLVNILMQPEHRNRWEFFAKTFSTQKDAYEQLIRYTVSAYKEAGTAKDVIAMFKRAKIAEEIIANAYAYNCSIFSNFEREVGQKEAYEYVDILLKLKRLREDKSAACKDELVRNYETRLEEIIDTSIEKPSWNEVVQEAFKRNGNEAKIVREELKKLEKDRPEPMQQLIRKYEDIIIGRKKDYLKIRAAALENQVMKIQVIDFGGQLIYRYMQSAQTAMAQIAILVQDCSQPPSGLIKMFYSILLNSKQGKTRHEESNFANLMLVRTKMDLLLEDGSNAIEEKFAEDNIDRSSPDGLCSTLLKIYDADYVENNRAGLAEMLKDELGTSTKMLDNSAAGQKVDNWIRTLNAFNPKYVTAHFDAYVKDIGKDAVDASKLLNDWLFELNSGKTREELYNDKRYAAINKIPCVPAFIGTDFTSIMDSLDSFSMLNLVRLRYFMDYPSARVWRANLVGPGGVGKTSLLKKMLFDEKIFRQTDNASPEQLKSIKASFEKDRLEMFDASMTSGFTINDANCIVYPEMFYTSPSSNIFDMKKILDIAASMMPGGFGIKTPEGLDDETFQRKAFHKYPEHLMEKKDALTAEKDAILEYLRNKRAV